MKKEDPFGLGDYPKDFSPLFHISEASSTIFLSYLVPKLSHSNISIRSTCLFKCTFSEIENTKTNTSYSSHIISISYAIANDVFCLLHTG